jgi:hypothetical protein
VVLVGDACWLVAAAAHDADYSWRLLYVMPLQFDTGETVTAEERR